MSVEIKQVYKESHKTHSTHPSHNIIDAFHNDSLAASSERCQYIAIISLNHEQTLDILIHRILNETLTFFFSLMCHALILK